MPTTKRVWVLAGCAAVLLADGCRKTDDSAANYAKAINDYYASRPACLWADEKKFPVQADTSDTSKTGGYDALVDQGLLTRTTDEKKRFLIGSKQVTNYDLSDKGRSAWSADTQQPGFGNFCYGIRAVTTIDSSTPTSDQPGAKTTVTYHTKLSGVPAWASAAETQTAFPEVQTQETAPAAGSATLTDTASGWAVTTGPLPARRSRGTTADASIVE